jgi:hypothetical protein
MKTRFCKGCDRTVEVPKDHRGAPTGWYNLARKRPDGSFNLRGMACGAACLIALALDEKEREDHQKRLGVEDASESDR